MLQVAVIHEKPDAAVPNGHRPVGPIFVQLKFDVLETSIKAKVRAFKNTHKKWATEPTPRMLPSSMPLKRSSKS